MNEIHLHLLTNHLPIIGVLIATIILISGLLLKKKDITSTGVFTLLFSGISAYIAHVTGEKAEHIAENIPGVTEALIEHHEESSQPFFILMLIVAAVALICIFLKNRNQNLYKYGTYLLAILGVASIGFSYKAGKSGGEIRHEEIREGYVVPSANEIESDSH